MKPFAVIAALLTLLLSILSCSQSGEGRSALKSMELVLVDSLVFDHLGPYNLLDYPKDKGVLFC